MSDELRRLARKFHHFYIEARDSMSTSLMVMKSKFSAGLLNWIRGEVKCAVDVIVTP